MNLNIYVQLRRINVTTIFQGSHQKGPNYVNLSQISHENISDVIFWVFSIFIIKQNLSSLGPSICSKYMFLYTYGQLTIFHYISTWQEPIVSRNWAFSALRGPTLVRAAFTAKKQSFREREAMHQVAETARIMMIWVGNSRVSKRVVCFQVQIILFCSSCHLRSVLQ